MDVRFFRQYGVNIYVLDFYCPSKRLAIEIDGGQHAEEIHCKHDTRRTEYLQAKDIQVLRFWNNEVMQNLEGVWHKIRDELDKRYCF